MGTWLSFFTAFSAFFMSLALADIVEKSLAIKYTFNYFFMDYFLFYIWH